eukprot:gene5055-7056_t
MNAFIKVLLCLFSFSNSFHLQTVGRNILRKGAFLLSDKKAEKAHETQIVGDAPYGKQFFAADVGVPTLHEDYGGGLVGGNDYKDALYHAGPRGKNKPKITEDAVIKLPSMATVERGFKDFRNPDGTMSSERRDIPVKSGPWSKEEEEKLKRLITSEPPGTRGTMARVAKSLNRTIMDCSTHWNQVVNPVVDSHHKDIVNDSIRPDLTWMKASK